MARTDLPAVPSRWSSTYAFSLISRSDPSKIDRAELAKSSASIGETGEPCGTPWSGLGAIGPQNPVSSYEANEVLTPTVPKQQWRPVSENELAYTAASAQCWVHA